MRLLSLRIRSLTAAVAIAGAAAAMEFTPAQRDHWAWKPPVRAPLPAVRATQPVDRFIQAKLAAAGLKPAPAASREELIRRLAFDLTGLPPTPTEVDAFLADRSPTAWTKVVDHYLASPAFGERWARHWLDLARYADSNGYEFDEVRPDMWRYRDYVVRAFNSDKPYDRFIREQLAGDLIARKDPDSLIATGFNLLGPDMTDAADQAARRQNTLNDMTDTAGLAFLGLTVGCARCHDHKYEPIPQADYYRLQAFFAGSQFRRDLPAATAEESERFQRDFATWDSERIRLRSELEGIGGSVRRTLRTERIAQLPEDLRTAFNLPEAQRMPDQQKLVEANDPKIEPTAAEIAPRLPAESRQRYLALDAQLRKHLARQPVRPVAVGLTEAAATPKTFILGRGELANREGEVRPGFPVILPAVATQEAPTSRRTALAEWITRPDNPLTARVMVNRVWQHLFGRGIVPTASDFGVRGESPTHLELLDWLAVGFASGEWNGAPGGERKPWSVKTLIGVVVMSNAYKQTSHASAVALAKDPENQLFSRQNRKRLEGEAVRDASLAVSGRLNGKMGGPGVFPPVPTGARPNAAVWPVTADPAEQNRRSLYIFVRRNLGFPALEVFDGPDTNSSCPRREVTTSAPQALTLMNGADSLANARSFAGRILVAARTTDERIALAYRTAFARKPTTSETQLGREFLARQTSLLRSRPEPALNLPEPCPGSVTHPEGAAWTDYCLALLNLNEFVYLD